MAQRRYRQPAIPAVPRTNDKRLTHFLEKIKEIIEVKDAGRGDWLEGNVTRRELIDANIANRRNFNLSNPLDDGESFEDGEAPPALTGLEATGGFNVVYLSWDSPNNASYSYTNIYRAAVDDLEQAEVVGTAVYSLFRDVVEQGDGATYYYWIKQVSKADVEGPVNQLAGTPATTAISAEYIEGILAEILGQTTLDDLLQNGLSLSHANQAAIDSMLAQLLGIEGDLSAYRASTDASIDAANEDLALTNALIDQTKTELQAAIDDTDLVLQGLRDDFDTSTSAVDSQIDGLQTQADTNLTNLTNSIDAVSNALDNEIQTVTDNLINRDLSVQNAITHMGILTLDLANKLGDIGPWLAETQTENATFRDAVSYVNPETGQIGLYAVDSVQGQLNQVSITLDAVENTIESKVSQDTFDAAESRLTLAESTITQHATDINLRATVAYVDGVATDILSGLEPIYLWPFNSDTDGFTATSNSTVTYSSGHINVVTTANGAGTERTGLSYTGGDYPVIQLQLKRISGGLNLKLEYQTGGSWYTGRTITDIPSDGTYHWENINLTTESTYVAGTITGIRLTWDTGEYDIGHVEIGQSTIQQLQLGDLEARIQQAEIDIDAAEADILLRATIAELNAEGARIDTVSIQLNALDNEVKLNAASVDLDVDGLIEQQASTETTLTALTNEQGALAAQITTLDAQAASNAASITQTNLALADTEKALAQQSNNLLATFGDDSLKAGLFTAVMDYINATDNIQSIASVNQETRALATADEAFAESLNAVTAVSNDNLAQVVTLQQAISSANSAAAVLEQVLTAMINGVDSKYEAQVTALSNEQGSVVSSLVSLESDVGTNSSTITSLSETVADNQASLAQKVDNLNALSGTNQDLDISVLIASLRDYQGNLGFVGSVANVRKEALAYTDATGNALASDLVELTAAVDSNLATLTQHAISIAGNDEAISQQTTELAAYVADNEAAIADVLTTMATEDGALSERISTTEAETGANSASIADTQVAITLGDEALTNQLNTLTSTVGTNTANITSEQTTRANEDLALALSVDALSTTVGDNQSSSESSIELLTTEDAAIASQVNAINVAVGENTASITEETTLLANDLISVVNDVTTLNTSLDDANTNLTEEATLRATEDGALGATVNSLTLSYGDVQTSITEETLARTTEDEALATRATSIETSLGAAETSITSESTARSTEDAAIAVQVDSVSTSLGDAQTDITSTQTSVATETQAIAQDVDALTTSLANTNAAVTSETTARSTETSAIAADVTNVTASLGQTDDSLAKARAAIGESFIASVDAGTETAVAAKMTELRADTDKTSAAISDTIIAQVAAGGKNILQRFSDMQLDVNGKVAQISYDATIESHDGRINDAQSSANGAQSAANAADNRATALSARAAMRVSANGVMTGWAMEAADDGSGGTASNFIISTQNFIIRDDSPNGVPVTPFSVVYDPQLGYLTYINNAVIKDASITSAKIASLTANKITAGTITAALTLNATYIRGGDLLIGNNVPDGNYAHISGTGKITARSANIIQGNFQNCTIDENCDVLGTVYANKITGDIVQPIVRSYSSSAIKLNNGSGGSGWVTIASLTINSFADYDREIHITGTPSLITYGPQSPSPIVRSVDVQCATNAVNYYTNYDIADPFYKDTYQFPPIRLFVSAGSSETVYFKARLVDGGNGGTATLERGAGALVAQCFRATGVSYGSWT